MQWNDVIVLFGGASGERRVSVASAQNIVEVIAAPSAWFVAPDGAVYDVARDALARHTQAFETDLPVSPPARWPTLAAVLDAPEASGKVFVLGFHGGSGEDGTLQSELERRGLAFTGSGSAASALAFDKHRAKECVRRAGIRVAESVVLDRFDAVWLTEQLGAFSARYGHLVVKPVADGSSVGLFHVREKAAVANTVAAILERKVPYIAESFVNGSELTIGVVDTVSGPRALCASEVRLDPGRTFDYEGKYLGKGTVELTPARVRDGVAQAACDVAVRAHRALGCEGYSRTDVIATDAGPVFLETNTLPGLTRASFVPQQLAHAKISLRDFLAGQVSFARTRASRSSS